MPKAESGIAVGLVVAASENNVIGREGELPWRLPADLARFKRLTMGHSLLMGRKTFESIGRPLPGRVSIVLTRDAAWRPASEEVLVARDLEEALRVAAGAPGVSHDVAMVVGGGEVYRLALPRANSVHLTRVHARIKGDATFPALDPAEWRLESSERFEADERNEHATTYEVWRRKE
ncbi:MAG: dihydrofolate reductase [Lacipirellulaceae bacterium]